MNPFSDIALRSFVHASIARLGVEAVSKLFCIKERYMPAGGG